MGTEEQSTEGERSAFETTAAYEQTTVEVYQEKFDKWVASPFKILWSDYRGRFGIVLVTIYILIGTIGVVIVPEPSLNQGDRFVQPFTDPEFLLGTDMAGRSLLSEMVHATPQMFQMIFAGAIFANLLGVSLGLMSGYLGGTTDKVIMTIADTVASIPGIPLLIILAAILEPTNPFLIGIMLSIQSWAGSARSLRSQVIPLATHEHVEASRAIGQPTSNLLVKDILPHLLPLIFIGFLGGATTIITASVGLYFLGILPRAAGLENWGITLNRAFQEPATMWTLDAAHWIIVPSVTIMGLTIALTLLAQSFDQVFNPRVRARHRARKHRPDEQIGDSDEGHFDSASAQQEGMGTI